MYIYNKNIMEHFASTVISNDISLLNFLKKNNPVMSNIKYTYTSIYLSNNKLNKNMITNY